MYINDVYNIYLYKVKYKYAINFFGIITTHYDKLGTSKIIACENKSMIFNCALKNYYTSMEDGKYINVIKMCKTNVLTENDL